METLIYTQRTANGICNNLQSTVYIFATFSARPLPPTQERGGKRRQKDVDEYTKCLTTKLAFFAAEYICTYTTSGVGLLVFKFIHYDVAKRDWGRREF